jgi:hypothetical protein
LIIEDDLDEWAAGEALVEILARERRGDCRRPAAA